MNTFPSKYFEKNVNDFSNPDQVPAVGDIIFIKTPYIYDHVAIVLDAPVGQNYIRVLEQNVGNGDGRGYDDRVKISTYDYSKVLGWYHYKTPPATTVAIPHPVSLSSRRGKATVTNESKNIQDEIVEKAKKL